MTCRFGACRGAEFSVTATMETVTAAYRNAMKAVHADTSGGASAWLSCTVANAYKQITAARLHAQSLSRQQLPPLGPRQKAHFVWRIG